MFNLPNQITIARLVVSLVVFILIPLHWFRTALAFFIVAAGTDWADGYLARKYGLVTQLGRILDPFADKILICGVFIFLVAEPQSRIAAWMAVLVVGRELLVTALRSFLEQQGADFSASMSGKLKMVFQCGAAVLSLYLLSRPVGEVPDWLPVATSITVWLAVISTIYSGIGYIFSAIAIFRRGTA
ncbi:MAG: CDP-diacylglycerol--glycerol-3-phosphate 3-phosphatidyltransferase [Planctomycetales bacterium]|nr:CDP-diacylglycerol--glycerol-3-phosphate 3-phosphatidyltransferase [Planctomycetales bacterium]